jgi:hypothetical protein
MRAEEPFVDGDERGVQIHLLQQRGMGSSAVAWAKAPALVVEGD